VNWAVCNETFGDRPHDRVCADVAAVGYTGLEVAPFTLAPLITDVTAERRAELRRQAEAEGVRILGLHWLLAKTDGFHLTHPDPAVRERTGDYLAELARCAADLGGGILVLGSPVQRNRGDASFDDAVGRAADTLGHCLPALDDSGVTLAVEPLGPTETDFLNTAAEAVRLIRALNHPRVRLHLDVKAMADEPEPTPDVIRANAADTVHFHANDPNRRGPGFGATDFVPILTALRDTGYAGWVSVEVFDYSPDPDTVARESLRYLRDCWARVTGERRA
jgi:sugar phosphate isomerase/epimerase